MGALKWIVGFLGWVSGGPIGALIGFLLGSFVDTGLDAMRQITGGGFPGQGGSSGYPGGGYAGGYPGGSTYQRQTTGSRGYTATEQRNSFMVSLLVLSSAVIKADGRIVQSELDHVRSFIRSNFGDAAVSDAMRILDELNRKEVNIYEVGAQIATYMNYSQRLQLFHYLAQIANADGDFSKSEKSVLEAIASAIRLNASDASSVIAMFYKDADSAYAVLEISPNATDDEVKSAYRRMAMKNHPDKVATLGPEVQKAAEEKFRKIQEAYETIKRQRGMS
ncbi:MAG: TerB family tellurite resistance protein [Bacteroidales bacterium]|nr:TerB family tellurite resistance protein [Bacteroidales bacterium]